MLYKRYEKMGTLPSNLKIEKSKAALEPVESLRAKDRTESPTIVPANSSPNGSIQMSGRKPKRIDSQKEIELSCSPVKRGRR